MINSGSTYLTYKRKARGDGGHRRQTPASPTGHRMNRIIKVMIMEASIVAIPTGLGRGMMTIVHHTITTFARNHQ